MQRSTLRYGILGLILLLALAATFGIQRLQEMRLTEVQQQAAALNTPILQDGTATVTPGTANIYLVDTEGWYKISPNERAVVARYNMKLGPDLLASIPNQLGTWRGTEEVVDPAVYTFIDPLYVTNRRYISGTNMVYFTLMANTGQRSFKLFEHTAAICYPTNDWKVLDTGIDEVPIGRGKIYVQKVVAQKETTTYITYYWFQWDNLQRNQESGTMVFKISAYVGNQSISDATANARNLISQLFSDTIQWRRF